MMIARTLAWSLAACASISVCHAGPCAADIVATQSRIDAWLQARAGAGKSAPESTDAKLRRQPTPQSIAAAEAKLGEVSAQTVDSIKNDMTRARAADNAGDGRGCQEALDAVQRTLGR